MSEYSLNKYFSGLLFIRLVRSCSVILKLKFNLGIVVLSSVWTGPNKFTVTFSPSEKGESGLNKRVLLFSARMILPVWYPLFSPFTCNTFLFKMSSELYGTPYLMMILVPGEFIPEPGTGERYWYSEVPCCCGNWLEGNKKVMKNTDAINLVMEWLAFIFIPAR